MHDHPIVKATLEISSVGILIGYFFDHLPLIATGLTSTYYFILILEKILKKK